MSYCVEVLSCCWIAVMFVSGVLIDVCDFMFDKLNEMSCQGVCECVIVWCCVSRCVADSHVDVLWWKCVGVVKLLCVAVGMCLRVCVCLWVLTMGVCECWCIVCMNVCVCEVVCLMCALYCVFVVLLMCDCVVVLWLCCALCYINVGVRCTCTQTCHNYNSVCVSINIVILSV